MTSDRRAAYRAFVADNAARQGADGYLFEAPRCRFALEPSDELVAPPGLRLRREGEAAIVELEGGGRLPISGIGFDKVRAVFSALPCRYSRLVLELGPQCDSFVEQAFSRVLFAPAAVAALEIDLPGLEIVRFPGSPYEIVRPYWRNSVAVRRPRGPNARKPRNMLRENSPLAAVERAHHQRFICGLLFGDDIRENAAIRRRRGAMTAGDYLSCLAAERTYFPDRTCSLLRAAEVDPLAVRRKREVRFFNCVVRQPNGFTASNLPQPDVRRARMIGDERKRTSVGRNRRRVLTATITRESCRDRTRRLRDGGC